MFDKRTPCNFNADRQAFVYQADLKALFGMVKGD